MLDIDSIARAQFRLDTNCTEQTEDKYRIMINESAYNEAARIYGDISTFFRTVIYMGDMYMSAAPEILDWAREKYSMFAPEWFCKFDNLRCLDRKLALYGYEIKDTHIYFLPSEDAECFDFECPYKIRWYDRNGIESIKGNPFKNALMYQPDCPDMLAVAAYDSDGRDVGMAGASADGRYLWQIGVDVLEDYRGHGIASYLTSLLRERILEMGKIPFYGTSESHAVSRRVAVISGFMPAWCEIYARKT